MSDLFYDLALRYGAAGVFVINFLSCLGFPIPALWVMLAAGALVAADGGAILPYLIFGYAGALLAGLIVFDVGRRWGPRILARMERGKRAGPLVARAHATHDAWGSWAILVATSFVAQLGPAVIVVAGSAGLSRWRFNLGHFIGRAIWVGGYLLMGFYFSGSVAEIAQAAGRLGWVAFGAVAVVIAFVLLRRRNG